MGSMRFASPSELLSDEVVERAYLSGYDRIPWRVSARRAGGELIIEREGSESGNLFVPWMVAGHGQVALSTCSLMQRDEPYHLPIELARGKLGQLRNQLADWEMAGMEVPRSVHEKIAEAMHCFGHGSRGSREDNRVLNLIGHSLRLALDAADLLADSYAKQSIAVRLHDCSVLPTSLGADLGISLLDESTSVEFLQAFNAANVPLIWREIEASQGDYYWDISDQQLAWCRGQGLTVSAGPLLRLDQWRLPEWIAAYDGDFELIMAAMSEHIQAVVERYRGQVDVWQCAARMNTIQSLGLDEQERIRLAARAVELVHALDPDAKAVVSFDQPWAEYLSQRDMDYSPLHFADALVRARLGLSGLVLEINVGYYPGGTMARDPLDFSRHLDHWSLLGVPLYVSLTVPSSREEDSLAVCRTDNTSGGQWNASLQEEWVARYLPLIMAKDYVQGVVWSQLRDCEPHDFAHGGLFDLQRQPKPALARLAELRKAHLR